MLWVDAAELLLADWFKPVLAFLVDAALVLFLTSLVFATTAG